METHLDCIPCFLHHGLCAVRRATTDQDLQRTVLQAWASRLAAVTDEEFRRPGPALLEELYSITYEYTGCLDPFAEDKRRDNERVRELLPRLEALVMRDADPLRSALAISIIGNFIDSGLIEAYDWEGALNGREDHAQDPALHGAAFQSFIADARPGAQVLILGDNAGEIGLDTLLVRTLADRGCRVTYAVRGAPVLNDATMEDAEYFRMRDYCTVTTSGVCAPGTLLDRCRPGFRDEMQQADVICSKGQGNFEALFGAFPGVYFAFKAKCAVVSGLVDQPLGSSVFIQA